MYYDESILIEWILFLFASRFLIEDHGNIEELDERLRNVDQVSDSTITRTRDSSFSVDSDGEFYSTPDDEEEYLIKDFDDQYERLQAERLQAMSKTDLIQEYLTLENKVEMLTKRLRLKSGGFDTDDSGGNMSSEDYQLTIERLTSENEALREENAALKSKMNDSCSSDSADSETDSSGSCDSSSSTSSMSRCESPVDYAETNGHSPGLRAVWTDLCSLVLSGFDFCEVGGSFEVQ